MTCKNANIKYISNQQTILACPNKINSKYFKDSNFGQRMDIKRVLV
jgi:hypothetical protein